MLLMIQITAINWTGSSNWALFWISWILRLLVPTTLTIKLFWYLATSDAQRGSKWGGHTYTLCSIL